MIPGASKEKLGSHVRRAAKNRGGGAGIQYLVSLQWPVVQLDFSDGMHMTEKSYMPQSARMRAQIQTNTGNFAGQRFSLHGVDLTKIDGGGARENQVSPWMPLRWLARPQAMHYATRQE